MPRLWHHSPDFVSKPDAADFASDDSLVPALVALNVYEELQHVIFKEVELVLINAALLGVIEQQSKKECPLILIVGFTKRSR